MEAFPIICVDRAFDVQRLVGLPLVRRKLFTAMSAATIVAALGLSGCSSHDESKPVPDPGTQSTTIVAAPSANAGPLPAPDALTGLLYRLADPAVKGADKLDLLENGTPDDADTIDRFAAALRDGGFIPLTCTASEIRWSDHKPDDALATVNITTANPDHPGGFTFPMEFHQFQGGWQLSRETADMLLAFGNARTGASPAPAPAPGPGPAPGPAPGSPTPTP